MSRLLLCVVVAFGFAVSACHPGKATLPAAPATAPQPAAPDHLAQANNAFVHADYAEATRNYEGYLRNHPAPQHEDEILFRLAISYAIEGTPVHDPDHARKILADILARFPSGPWRDQANLFLGLNESLRQRELEVSALDVRIEGMKAELAAATTREAEARARAQQLQTTDARERKDKDARIKQLASTVEELEEKFRLLTIELEALKKIDMQRRPSRPPR